MSSSPIEIPPVRSPLALSSRRLAREEIRESNWGERRGDREGKAGEGETNGVRRERKDRGDTGGGGATLKRILQSREKVF